MQDYINTGITFKGKFNNDNLIFKGKRPKNNIEYEVKINTTSIYDTNLICDPKKLLNVIDWVEGPHKDSGETYKHLCKIPISKSKKNRAFLEKFLPGFTDYAYNKYSKNDKNFKLRVLPKNFDLNILPDGWKVILDTLSNKGFFNKGKKITSKKELLDISWTDFIKIFYEKLKNTKEKYDWLCLMKYDLSPNSCMIQLKASINGNEKKDGVYYFTIGNRKPSYVGKARTFREVKNSYTKGSFKNIFPNNKSTRGRINGIIAREVNKNHKEKINWYIIPLEKTNIINIFEDANIDLDKSFKARDDEVCHFNSPHCDFLEWLMMQTQDKDKSWNRSRSKFGDFFVVDNTIS